MWIKILKYKDFSSSKLFVILNSLVKAILFFPYSNTEAEKIFSIVSDVKTRIRIDYVMIQFSQFVLFVQVFKILMTQICKVLLLGS